MGKVRKILFRAKAINRNPNREYRTNYKNGDWVYGLLTDELYEDDSDCGSLPAHMKNEEGVSGIDVDFDTLGQYVGLKDIGGKKIYEGDIFVPLYVPPCSTAEEVIKLYDFDEDEIGVVTFDHGNFTLKKKNSKDCILSCYVDQEFSHYEENVGQIYKYKNDMALGKVIGNIYDNPELLDKQDIAKKSIPR